MATASQDPSVSSPPHYRAISLWAVLSVVCGVASATMILFGWLGGIAALGGRLFWPERPGGKFNACPRNTGAATGQNRHWPGGRFGNLASAWLIFFASKVPHGYQELNWADLEPDANKKNERIPSTALALGDPNKKTKVYVRGYILPGRQQVRLKEFSICRTSDQCRFAIKANNPTDLIHVELMGDRTIDYTTYEVGLGGIFEVDPDFSNGTPYHLQSRLSVRNAKKVSICVAGGEGYTVGFPDRGRKPSSKILCDGQIRGTLRCDAFPGSILLPGVGRLSPRDLGHCPHRTRPGGGRRAPGSQRSRPGSIEGLQRRPDRPHDNRRGRNKLLWIGEQACCDWKPARRTSTGWGWP